MIYIINDLGKRVVAVGMEGSDARLSVQYPFLLSLLSLISSPWDHRKIFEDHNVPREYWKALHRLSRTNCGRPSLIDITEFGDMTRDDIVPLYVDFMRSNPSDEVIRTVNYRIVFHWSGSGLLYIKERAWSGINRINRTVNG